MLEIEVLHSYHGDKRPKFDTDSEAGRKKASEFINGLIRKGTAVVLTRGKKDYLVKRYDPKTDTLAVMAPVHGKEREIKARGRKSKATAVPPISGGAR